MKLIVLLLLSSICFSQSKNILDEKYGFKTIKFDTPKNVYDSIKQISKQLYLYETDNVELKNVFDIHFDNLFLAFNDNDLLIGVSLMKEINQKGDCHRISAQELNSIKDKFEAVLGKFDKIINDKSGYGFLWSGKMVTLKVIAKINDIGFDSNDNTISSCSIKIIFKKTETTEELKNGF